MHVLVIANQTLAGRAVFERLALLSDVESVEVYLLVPATHSEGFEDRVVDGVLVIDEEARRRATERLEAALSTIRALGIEADGEVGNPDPLLAARMVLESKSFDRILLATMPSGSSRWLRMDLVHRLRRATDTLVEHLEAEPEPPTADAEPSVWEGIRTTSGSGPLQILLVDDNVADVELTQIALDRSRIDCEVAVAKHGADALEQMRARRPDLVLLDLAMPLMDGHELLSHLRLDPDLHDVPVVVLTTSTRAGDRDKAHELGARAHIVKENDFARFQEVLDGVLVESLTA